MDKLTILEIKMLKIPDSRRADCEKEFELLAEQLEPYRKKFAYYYRLLMEINLGIWEIQDRFHGKDVSPSDGATMCRKILEENDRRFRVKAKINVASGSPLREQKGYREKTAVLNAPLELEMVTALNGAVRYLSTAYDSVIVSCHRRDEVEIRQMYEDDPCIELRIIGDESGTGPIGGLADDLKGRNDITVYSCGLGGNLAGASRYPESLYEELNLPYELRERYFHAHNADD